MSGPNHVAIIMDGNGRWAQNSCLPRLCGHTIGVNVARKIIDSSIKLSLSQLTLFALSIENMSRPHQEVSFLLKLFAKMIKQDLQYFSQKNVKFNFIGERAALPEELRDLLSYAEKITSNNSGLLLTIAVNYSGRWHLLNSFKDILNDINSNKLSSDIDEELISKKINASLVSDPDLVIRTGGEKRISNFLLWSLAYSEIYFSDCYWPDFSAEHFLKALDYYRNSERRFGLISGVEYE
ncbi:MAG: polyprenyl diphosphate synthase [Pseudomonadota bacterium]|nr:polyprenyl diphosphate synthase [Pseudomonadota bacterium]